MLEVKDNMEKRIIVVISAIGCITGLLWINELVINGAPVALLMLGVTVLAIAATVMYAKAHDRKGYVISAALYAIPVVVSIFWFVLACQPMGLFGSKPVVLIWPPTTVTVLVCLPVAGFVAGFVASVIGAVRDGMATQRLTKKW